MASGKNVGNQPVSHVFKGQGGRTVGTAIRASKGKRKVSSEHLKMRIKNQLQPKGLDRFPYGKYVKTMPDGSQDPKQAEAWSEMAVSAAKRSIK